jgi:hypothetical protein
MHAQIKELLKAAFSMQPMLRLYRKAYGQNNTIFHGSVTQQQQEPQLPAVAEVCQP